MKKYLTHGPLWAVTPRWSGSGDRFDGLRVCEEVGVTAYDTFIVSSRMRLGNFSTVYWDFRSCERLAFGNVGRRGRKLLG